MRSARSGYDKHSLVLRGKSFSLDRECSRADFGSDTVHAPLGVFSTTTKLNGNTVRIGLNYKFDNANVARY
jgi:hypothetical protein